MDLLVKYPDNNFDHWVSMFIANNNKWTISNYEKQIDMYKAIEGLEEFTNLQDELRQIVINNDLQYFLSEITKRSFVKIGLADLELMAKTIIHSNLHRQAIV